MSKNVEMLFQHAKEAMKKAYAPYSHFQVGAAILAGNGKIYSGANVENAAYPQGNCAEASAIAAMIMDNQREVVEMAVIGKGDALVTPCGGCRQRIREFARSDAPIHICGPEGVKRSFTLGELLPFSFGPEHLGKS